MKLNKSEILQLLKNSDGYLSGQELCTRYGATRAAIWKAIGALREEGYEIEAVPNRGYRLVGSADVLNESELTTGLETKWIGQKLVFQEKTGSTNTDVKALGEEGAPAGCVVVAGEQTGGKGRRGRVWLSPPGSGIYFSILLRPEVEPSDASMLTLVIALSTARAIRKMLGLTAQIKWPNDIVVEGKKVCGILTEMTLEDGYIGYVVVGVGINVNNASFEEFPEETRNTATSLRIQKGEVISRAHLWQRIMEEFEADYEKFVAAKNLSPLAKEYGEYLVNRGRVVRVLDPKGEYEGIATGIDDRGQLLVQKEDGSIVTVYAGEVSVRGIYGYV